MAYSEAGNEGSLTGTTEKELIPAPASGRYIMRYLKIVNKDTVAHDITLRHSKGATDIDHTIEDLGPGEWVEFGEEDRYVLDDTDEVLRALTDANATTTEPVFVVSYEVAT